MRDPKSTLLYRWFQEVWNQGREDSIDKLMTHDSNAHGIIADGQPKGAEGFKIFYRDFRKQFRNIQIDFRDVVSEDNMESALTTVSATHAETGKRISFSGLCMVRIEGGKIAEAWNHYDFLNMYQQLGLVLVTPDQV